MFNACSTHSVNQWTDSNLKFLVLFFSLVLIVDRSRCWNNWLDNSQCSQRHATLCAHSVFVVTKKLPSIVRCVVLKPKKFLNVVLRLVSTLNARVRSHGRCLSIFVVVFSIFCHQLHLLSCHRIENRWISHVEFQSAAAENQMQDQLSINLQQSFTQFSLLSDLHTKDTIQFSMLLLCLCITFKLHFLIYFLLFFPCSHHVGPWIRIETWQLLG